MPAGSLPGALLLLTAAYAADGKPAPVVKSGTPWRVATIAAPRPYRLPAAVPLAAMLTTGPRATRSDRVDAGTRPSLRDPGGESVSALLRDRLARRGGALDAKVQWRLTGAGSDLGLGGGLARVVDTILHD